MPTIKLTKVNIGPFKNVATFKDGQGVLTSSEVMVVELDGTPTIPEGSTWIRTGRQITFSTPSGELSDKEYATQANGFHWVKIAGYRMYKIPPEYITNNTLSQAGIDYIKSQAEAV